MDSIDVDALLVPFSDESPCGEDLEYDSEFSAMERAALGAGEQQFGDTIIEAKPPEWREVKEKSLELLTRTKDLRVASYLTKALLQTEGLIGFGAGLSLVQRLISSYWDSVHPQLDPDDDNDPTLRVNTLLTLCDPNETLPGVRTALLVKSRAVGQFSLRDILLATGETAPPEGAEEELPNLAAIDAAFMDVDLEALQEISAAASQAVEDMDSIEQMLLDKVGATNAVDLSELTTELKRIRDFLTERLNRRGVADPDEDEEEAEAAEQDESNGSARSGGNLDIGNLHIRSREEVVRTLDKICEYYQRNEPSSPLPLLLERAKRLVPLGFMELLRDLAPEGVEQAEAMRGGTRSGESGDSDYSDDD